jgi:hypothetical protein
MTSCGITWDIMGVNGTTHSAGALSKSGEAGPRVGAIKRRLNLRISCCSRRNRFRRHVFLRFWRGAWERRVERQVDGAGEPAARIAYEAVAVAARYIVLRVMIRNNVQCVCTA